MASCALPIAITCEHVWGVVASCALPIAITCEHAWGVVASVSRLCVWLGAHLASEVSALFEGGVVREGGASPTKDASAARSSASRDTHSAATASDRAAYFATGLACMEELA